jgi:hypothetical protein
LKKLFELALVDRVFQHFTKERKVRQIATNFARQEEINFSNFKFVLEMIKEMEDINDRLGFLHLDIDERYILHETRIHQQRNTLEELEDVLEEIEGEASESETKLKETDEIFNALVQGVSRLFEMCKCSKDPLLRLLGNNTTVKFYNILLYLEVLEQTIHQYLITAAYIDKTKKVTDEKKKLFYSAELRPVVYPIDKIVTSTPCSLLIHKLLSFAVVTCSWFQVRGTRDGV